jgi:nicotinamidase-related amidase
VRAYLDPASPLYAGVEAAQVAAIRLVQASRTAGIPLIHTHFEYQPGGADSGIFFRKIKALSCFERDHARHLAAFAPGLGPSPGETVVTKQYASAFFGHRST